MSVIYAHADNLVIGVITRISFVVAEYIHEPEACQGWSEYEKPYYEPGPKKVFPKQAQVRQSIRQSMRSVNRNR